MLKKQQRFESNRHDVLTEEINNIALSLNDIKEYSQLILQKHMHMEQAKI